ncbi:piggyBac transposable element-derived protein 4-like [Bombus vosnesenskii]|uniref:PiggyBac transposable element-derived protein 4-like n=1 Tax=Bombus vosnesenskii TaxID=207650 RepID=A0A6J3K3L1_9HYME|nr:piggyBac transposable element-derived protein 4-like [Bombus vosnesenskii]
MPKLHIFDEQNAGVKGNLNPESTPLDVFQMIFSEELVAQITEQTNNYFKCVQQCTAYKKNSRLTNWKDASVPEMYVFLCISMLMPRSKKLSLREYWSTDQLLKSNIFRKIMARDRYMVLLQMLHFNDNNTANLLLYKGRCYSRQFIPSKRSRFGIKLFLLSDCETNYVLNFITYTGQKTNISRSNTAIGISGDVVMTLLQLYLGKGHTLITDNCYTSPRLYTLLHENKTNAFGTVRKNRKDMLHMEEKLKRGEMCYRSTGILLAIKWHDKKEVRMLFSAHGAALIKSEKRDYRTGLYKKKPSCIADYNSNMSAVDRVNMILSTLNSPRKTIKWYKKLFFHLLDLAIYNAYILYQKSTASKQKFNEFHLALIRDILRKYFQRRSMVGGGKRKSEDLPFRLIDRHFPSKCPNRAGTTQLSRRKCVVCVKNKRRNDTRYECRKCDVRLCIDNCFESFHT